MKIMCPLFIKRLFFPKSGLAIVLSVIFILGDFQLVHGAQVNALQTIRYNASTNTNVVIGQNSAMSTVDLYSSIPTTLFNDTRVGDYITLGIDYDMLSVFDAQAYQLKVRIQIVAYDRFNNLVTVNSGQALDLQLDIQPFTSATNYLDKSTFQFKDAYKYTITITDIWKNGIAINTLPQNVFVNSEIRIERFHDFSSMINTTVSSNAIVALDLDCVGPKDEIQFSWTAVPNAEEYQLEWTFVNDYEMQLNSYIPNSDSRLQFDFKNNSSRVTLPASGVNKYAITLAFDHGYIIFRIRAVGRDIVNPAINLYSLWNVPDFGTVGSINFPNKVYFNNSSFESNKNWQYAASYAEEGKKKEIVNFFDGSLRNRQVVTKINSDNNVIVGEKIYDHQGRPAINTLPVPVPIPLSNLGCTSGSVYQEPAIKYYDRFNTNNSNSTYSRLDFDKDASTYCAISTAAMSTSSGSSKYYSPNNQNQTDYQKFVPDAKGYPFSQTEFTPDNTGRIARQSGVGPEFQLNSKHETKYYYGSPAQIQLNRLFGSEVGNASRYKKNLVIDANGQISISYLDQEGHTIATSLAGDAPQLANGDYPLEPLASELGASKSLHVDLFKKDGMGLSILNTANSSLDAIVFNQQILIDADGPADFKYNLDVGQFLDPCLRDNICISCVYDLEIRVTDECGTNLINPNISKRVGSFSSFFNPITNREEIIFNCVQGQNYDVHELDQFSIFLKVGVYTISKILTLNQQALELYQQAYIDSVYNSCVKTENDFINEAMLHIDTSDCYINCSSCVASLGLRDDFVAQGKGTAAQYDALVEQCQRPCKLLSVCEATYEMLLSDVKPGGQYGEYSTTVGLFDPQNFPLSVYNLSNFLPDNITPGNKNWKNPVTDINGTNYAGYYEEDGTRSVIIVSLIAGDWHPALDGGVTPIFDPLHNYYTAYPEQLLNLSDFIYYFKTAWAKGLVQYHPEYCYYKSCKSFSTRQGSNPLSSDEFDQKMRNQLTFYSSGSTPNDFIDLNYLALAPNNRLQDFIKDLSSSTPNCIDPFFTPNSDFQANLVAAGSLLDLHNSIENRLLNYSSYMSSGGLVNVSMTEMAAMLERCPSYSTGPVPSNCTDFGVNVPTTTKDEEWKKFVTFYLGEKAKLQQDYEHEISRLSCRTNNVCIGEESFSPWQAGMLSTGGAINFWQSPYFDPHQPCSVYNFLLYKDKVKRFADENDIDVQTLEEAEYQMYLQTGQCPLAFQFQNFLNGMAVSQKLTAANEDLTSHGEFTPALYDVLNGTPAVPSTTYSWQLILSTPTVLNVKLVNNQTGIPKASIKIDISGSGIASWSDIQGIAQLNCTSNSPPGTFNFTAKAKISVGGIISYKNISGSTSINIKDCNFPEVCTPNQLALDLNSLLTGIATSNNLTHPNIALSTITGTPPFPAPPINLNALVTPIINTSIGLTPGTTHQWAYLGPNKFQLRSSSGITLEIEFTSATPSTFTLIPANFIQIKAFSNIVSHHNNLFEIDVMNAAGIKIASLEGLVRKIDAANNISPLEMGNCELPTPLTCQSNGHLVRADLEVLINNIKQNVPAGNLTGTNIDLFNNSFLTNTLKANLPIGTTYSNSYLDDHSAEASPYQDLIFNFGPSRCNLILHLNQSSTIVNFNQFVGLSSTPLEATGTPDSNGDCFNFSSFAVFNVNGTNVTYPISGSSCFPIKNCNPCPTNINPSTASSFVSPTGNQRQANQSRRAPLPPSEPIPINILECRRLYEQYTNTINQYNNSFFAQLHNHQLPILYNSWDSFFQAQLCNCIKYYINYIQSYLGARPNTGLSVPVALNQFTACGFPASLELDTCKLKFEGYVSAVNQYQVYAASNGLPSLQVLNYDTYIIKDYCNCIEQYIDKLNFIVENNLQAEDLIAQQIYLDSICTYLNPPCSPEQAWLPNASPSYTALNFNDCVKQIINTTIFNAQNAYQQYIQEIANDFAIRYKKHCMAAVENFFVDYKDKEYHFTLYYYDQAGNLIKTVPPEGVRLLNTTSDVDAIANTLKQDRLNNTQSIYTEHQMATLYEYNSLNQLVRQSVPDHEKMDLFEYTLPNGLDANLKISSIQFISSTKGYLTGTIKTNLNYGTNSIDRGFLYTSNDGGQNWSKVQDLVASNINKVQMVDAQNGFAVCENGILLRTSDGGGNWDFIPLYLNNYYATGVIAKGTFANLNDLYFRHTLAGNIEGVIVGNNGLILYTTDGGNTFFRSSGVPNNQHITGVSFDGSAYFLTTKYNQSVGGTNYTSGNLFKATNLATGFIVQRLAVSDLKTVCWYNTDNAYAAGIDGSLLRFYKPANTWYIVPTGKSEKILDIHFKNQAEGVAIFENAANSNAGNLFKTTDGGLTWTPKGPSTDLYVSLNEYDTDKLIGVGKQGLVSRILLTAAPFGIIKLTAPGNKDLNSGDAKLYVSSGLQQLQIMVVGNDQDVYVCNDGLNSINTWTTISISTSDIPSASSGFKKVLIETPNANNLFNGVLISKTGRANAFTRNASTLKVNTTSGFITPSGSGPGYADMVYRLGFYYLLNNNDKRLTRFSLAFASSGTVAPVVNNLFHRVTSPLFLGVISSIHLNADYKIIAVGSKGAIYLSANVSTNLSNLVWTDLSSKVVAAGLNDVSALRLDKVYMVGDDGYEFFYSLNISRPINLGTSTNLNAIKTNSSNNTALIGGNQGLVYLQSLNGLVSTASSINIPITDHVTDIAYANISGTNKAYLSYNSGQLVHIPTFSSINPVACLISNSNKLNGVCFKFNSSNALAAGNASTMFNLSGLTGTKLTSIHSPALKDVHFLNLQNGYVIGNYGYIRHTSNGCTQFQLVNPKTNATGFTAKLNAVLTTQNDHAAIVGQNYSFSGLNNKAYIGNVVGNTIPSTLSVPTFSKPINDIEGHAGFMVMVTDGGNYYTANATATSYTILNRFNIGIFENLNGVHVFGDKSFITCGDNKTIKYVTSSGVVQNANSNIFIAHKFNDIFFHDDRMGYVVGDGGAFYKVDHSTNIQSGGVGSWQSKLLNDDYGVNSGNAQLVNIKAVAFTNRYNGIIGGDKGFSTKNYARLINDESGYFSSRFWYDKLGRLVVSQNTKQFDKLSAINNVKHAYSYTQYDALGRIQEVGEKFENSAIPFFKSVFGTQINGYNNPLAIDDNKLSSWLNNQANTSRFEITKTYYDLPFGSNTTIVQNHLRKRVAAVTYEDAYDGNNATYEHGSYYSYDVHGNVNSLWQENKKLATTFSQLAQQSLKRMDYEYDLISGKVNKVWYQKNQPDLFIHKYAYDADNRITEVFTSKDNINWDGDAKYLYYAHGPLARTETGDLHVQGTDYAYTLQGWIKGVNSNVLEPENDMGKDGLNPGIANNHGLFAQDAFSYSLNYFTGDYQSIDPNWNSTTNKRFIASYATGSDVMSERFDLYNGNITSMVTTLVKPQPITATSGVLQPSPQAMSYRYDQLNRLLEARAYTNLDIAANEWQVSGNIYNNSYFNTFSYDANGNIKSQKRCNDIGTVLDELTYHYYQLPQGTQQNRLYHVNDAKGPIPLSNDDLVDQGQFLNTSEQIVKNNNNYKYDGIGNLIQDKTEEIAQINWTVSGKIKSIVRTPGSLKPSLSFDYDASGNRIAKHTYSNNSLNSSALTNSIYYLRDAQGNTMSVYKLEQSSATLGSYKLQESHIYGSSRLGIDNYSVELINLNTTTYVQANILNRNLGLKQFEFGNHLGNVLVTSTDKKIPRDINGDGQIDIFFVDILSSTDYYPGGMLMPGRNYNPGNYRYGFGSHEMDNEVKGTGNWNTFGDYGYDSRLVRRPGPDPKFKQMPNISPYAVFFNNPIMFKDESGKFPVWTHYHITYSALIKMKVSEEVASEIAHYASTYADHPTTGFMVINQALAVNYLFNPSRLSYDDDKYGPYDKSYSQKDNLVIAVSIHAMRTYWEDITPEEAVKRALYGGTFKEQDGTEVRIVGAYEVVNSLKGKDINKLSKEEMKMLGVALHTIQDAEIHKGGRWVDEHKEEAKKMGTESEHPDAYECGTAFGLGDETVKASKKTDEALQTIEKK